MAVMNDGIVRLTRRQVREVDRRAIEVYGVPGIVLMENAARGAVEVAWEMLGSNVRRGRNVVIVCGSGNNGGDGLAVARHLHNRGVQILVVLAADEFKGDAATNWEIVREMDISRCDLSHAAGVFDPRAVDLIVDALFGTGLTRAVKGDLSQLIDQMNASEIPILAIDLPSGLDCDTGEPLGPDCVRATRTVTFVAEKAGFANPVSRQYTGDVVIADIGCPKEIIDAVLREVPA
jgi:NAD(P)H-hydrate epimerase